MNAYLVKDLPSDDRPREKLISRGAENLTDAELIAILLRTGKKGKSVIQIAQQLLKENENLAVLASKSLAAFKSVEGIGKDKAATLAAAFELSRRISSQKKQIIEKVIHSPSEVAEFFIPLLRDKLKENFLVVCLSSAKKIIKYNTIFVGSLNASVVHPREIFKEAIENSAASIILLHNHPSGNPEPSQEDIMITKKLVDAGKIIDIPVLDHLIIAGDTYTSLVEKRII